MGNVMEIMGNVIDYTKKTSRCKMETLRFTIKNIAQFWNNILFLQAISQQ